MLDAYGMALIQGMGKERLHFYDDKGGSVSLLFEKGYFYKLIAQLVNSIKNGI